jgi:hypothetical protein
MAKNQDFITLKDHKPNFKNNLQTDQPNQIRNRKNKLEDTGKNKLKNQNINKGQPMEKHQ